MRKWLRSVAKRFHATNTTSDTAGDFQRLVLKTLAGRFGGGAFHAGNEPLSIRHGETQFGLQSLLRIAQRDGLAGAELSAVIVDRFERILGEIERHPGETPLYWTAAKG